MGIMDLWFEIAVIILLFLIWITSRTSFYTEVRIPNEVLKQIRDQLEQIKNELREIRRQING
jgi:hypothetical protein